MLNVDTMQHVNVSLVHCDPFALTGADRDDAMHWLNLIGSHRDGLLPLCGADITLRRVKARIDDYCDAP